MRRITLFAATVLAAAIISPCTVPPAAAARGRGSPRYEQAPVGRAVRELPRGHIRVMVRGVPYYWHAGWFYRPVRRGYVVVAPPIGAFVPWLPFECQVVWFGARAYFHADGVYYMAVPGAFGYVVVEPPEQVTAAPQAQAPARAAAIAPTKGQEAAQQARDRYQCHLWAVSESGYDPSMGIAAPDSVRAAYERAMRACLEARGYSYSDSTK